MFFAGIVRSYVHSGTIQIHMYEAKKKACSVLTLPHSGENKSPDRS